MSSCSLVYDFSSSNCFWTASIYYILYKIYNKSNKKGKKETLMVITILNGNLTYNTLMLY